MDEDIDTLLEEFENEFINANSAPISKPTVKQKKPLKFGKDRLRSDASIDVDDILTLDLDEPKSRPVSNKSTEEPNQSTARCYPTFIGGSTFPLGCTKPGVTRTCSALFCSSCDFKITHFTDYEWTERVEYIFLRTNMPHFDKMKEKLKSRKGSNAYACQCTSYSTRTLEALYAVPFLPWFCKGHFG